LELRLLFGPFLPGGNFVECLYFLPIGFRVLGEGKTTALEFVDGLIWWISKHHAALEARGVAPAVERALVATLGRLTSDFEVVHYDNAACRAAGWSLDHDDIVHGSELLAQMLIELERFRVWKHLALDFVRRLRDAADAKSSAWYVEYARRRFDAIRHPIQSATAMLADPDVLAAKIRAVRRSLLWESAPSYWRDVVVLFGVDADCSGQGTSRGDEDPRG
jgi:hypothetical protein